MAMAMVASPSFSSSDFDYSQSQHGNDISLRYDELWSEVDIAERYLVSSRHDEAAATSLAVLRKLKDNYFQHRVDSCRHNDGGMDENEVADIIESAGMVAIQAYSESGRSRLIFKDLETIFGCLSTVPASVFLAGLCFQLSANFYLEAQMSVESFFKHWAFPSNANQLCEFKVVPAQIFVPLHRQQYIEIANIYMLEVLAKGLGRVDVAVHWVKQAEIPSETKQGMLKSIEELSARLNRKKERDSSGHEKMGASSAELVASSASSAYRNSATQTRLMKQVAKDADSHSLLKIFPVSFYIMEVLSGWRSSSFGENTAGWIEVLASVHRRKPILTGAAAVFVMIALYKKRLNLSRVIGGLIKLLKRFSSGIYMGLFDFWQLAFNVQLNPLAAVQPLQHAHHGR